MANDASKFIGDIPKYYDSGLGPNIFEHFAQQVAKRSVKMSPHSVLEIAAGTGFVSRHLRNALPDDASLTVTDLNGPMLDVAKSKFQLGENVSFETANAMDLPFEDASFDQVVCQFGVMFFPDIVASFVEAKRVLKPGGCYIFSTWGKIENNPFSEVAHNTIAEFFPNDPPGFYKVPFCYHDHAVVLADLAKAGLPNANYEEMTHEHVITDMAGFAQGLVFGNPVRAEVVERGGDPLEVTARVHQRLTEKFGEEPAKMPLQIGVYTVVV